jgi:hypothetical protein
MSRHFDARYEYESIESGMATYLEQEVGQTVLWYVFDAAGTEVDNTFDVGTDYLPGGRRWEPPVPVKCINAIRTEGAKQFTDGEYTSDTIHLILSANTAQKVAMPDLIKTWPSHLRDRLVWQGTVYTPTRIELRGVLEESYTVIGIDLIQVNPDELIDDPDFARYAA